MPQEGFPARFARAFFVTVILLLAGAGCSRQPPASDSETRADQAKGKAEGLERRQAELGELAIEDLRSLGNRALSEQRIHSPAGDNATEYYIALRKASPQPDATAESALMDLQPYVVIAAEQAIVRADFPEAERLHRLIAAADPLAPSLQRIAEGIAQGKSAEALRAEASEAVASQAMDEAPSPAAPAKSPVIVPPPASAPVAASQPKPAAILPAQATPAAETMSTPTSPPAPVETRATPVEPTGDPIALRSPSPAYPPEEKRFGAVVAVTATFTVNADGSVGDIQANVEGTRSAAFERSVKTALRRWQFAPIAQSRSVTRRFTFKP